MLPDPSIMSHLMKTCMPDAADRPKPRSGSALRLWAGLRAAIARRSSASALEAKIARLASLSPHLLPDIGLDPQARELVEPAPSSRPDMPAPVIVPVAARPRAGRARATAAVQAATGARSAPAAQRAAITTGSATPLRVSWRVRAADRSRPAACHAAEARTSPGAAAAAMRAGTFTSSPKALMPWMRPPAPETVPPRRCP